MPKKREEIEETASGSEEAEDLGEEEELSDEEEMDIAEDDENLNNDDEEAGPSGLGSDGESEKKKKRGIIYISSIPKFMNVTILREMLSEYAKIGRVYLQPGKLSGKLQALK